MKKSGSNKGGKNLTVWFPDEAEANKLAELADELKTSSSAIIYELVRKCIPVIAKNREAREVTLDGVKVSV
jgi:hypothetical protein